MIEDLAAHGEPPEAPTPDAWTGAVEAAIHAGDMARAVALAEQALAAGVQHPALLNLRAFRAEHEGRLEDSLADLRRARELAPEDALILNALGLCLTRLERNGEAIVEVVNQSDIQKKFRDIGFEPMIGQGVKEFTAHHEAEVKRWVAFLAELGLRK